MPEIKNVFNQGKMNKDLDERLVPNGQYIDANNIQVTTSESSDAGTVQSLLGNSAIPVSSSTTITNAGVCVGSIADEKNNCAYWLVASSTDWSNSIPTSTLTYKDVIYRTQYNGTTNTHTVEPVFIDFWLEKQTTNFSSTGGTHTSKSLGSGKAANLAVGMYVTFVGANTIDFRQITNISTLNSNDTITFGSYTYDTGEQPLYLEFTWQEPDLYRTISFGNGQFKNRVLRFDKDKLITGLNIVDDLLFWTDNNTEPKKINIERSIAGTEVAKPNKSTRVIVEKRNIDLAADIFVTEQDVTVIKKSPKKSPFLELNTGFRSGILQTMANVNFDNVNISDIVDITIADAANYASNDILIFSTSSGDAARVRVKTINDKSISFVLLSTNSGNMEQGAFDFNVRLFEEGEKLYEEKFVRFATRWKYVDGEYSAISPFSQPAFVPGSFKYNPVQSFNTGMVNNLKELIVKDFIPINIPSEVVQVDILYKESDSPIIYSVDNISYDDLDETGVRNIWNTVNTSSVDQGKYVITSEKVNAIIPSNQILRPWDAVPRKALGQSVVGNRIVYANYLQNFNLVDDNGGIIKPKINSALGFRNGIFPELLTNPLANPVGASSSSDPIGWNFNSGWGLVDYTTLPPLHGGFEESVSTGVTRFSKVWQNLTLEDEKTYRVRLIVSNYIQGAIKVMLISPTKNNTFLIDSNGEYDFDLTLNKDNGVSATNIFNAGKTFFIQSETNINFIGQITNFSCKEKTKNIHSIKSQRSYQVGIVYADEFGRQTPVLTDVSASMKVGKVDSPSQNSITVKLENDIPSFADSFKFFVKETSSPYHNLAVDRIYNAIDGNAWLSFPSSERNKIDEEDYLILKKSLGNNNAVVDENATYKILAISNEAPNNVKKSRKTLGTATGLATASGSLNGVFSNVDYRPVDDQLILAIKKDVWINDESGADLTGLSDLVLRFNDGGTNRTGFYQIDEITITNVGGDDYYFFNLNTPIIDFDAEFVMNGANFKPNITLTISRELVEDKPEFDGKFFVKLNIDDSLRDFVLSQATLLDNSLGIVARARSFYASDDVVAGVGIGTSTRYQKDSTSILTFTNTTCILTNNDATVAVDANTAIEVGMSISGDGVPDDATVVSVNNTSSVTSFEMSAAATSGNGSSDESLTFTPHNNDVRLKVAVSETSILTDYDPDNGNFGGRKFPFTSSSDGGFSYDESGDSGYSPGRGTMIQGFNGNSGHHGFVMSEYSVNKWGRILKFLKYSSWNYNSVPNNAETRTNFFIDRVRYVGIQPFTENNPSLGNYQNPGYWDHSLLTEYSGAQLNATSTDKCGRGIFKATGSETVMPDINGSPVLDTFFTAGKFYMELSYSKIWAESGHQNIKLKNIDDPAFYQDAWSVGQSNNTRHSAESLFVSRLAVGSLFRFSGDASETVYKIKKIRQQRRYNHTVYPGGNGNFPIAKSANPSSHYIFPDDLKTSDNYGANGGSNNLEFSVSDVGGELKTPYPAGISNHVDNIKGRDTINAEKVRFGLATNRRLTWTMEIENASLTDSSVPGFGNYSPLNITQGVDTNLMGEDSSQFIEFVEPTLDEENQIISDNPAIFETKPKTTADLDVYYEASDFISIGEHDSFHELPWFNCYSFGNGVESNRIKDDFNQVFLDKNAIVSTTLEGEYEEDQRKYGLIYSGIYNTTTSTNQLNQFIAAEKITKEINPEYGSIQKLYARNSDLVALCEDKVLRILSKKDAVFNADGNTNLTATSNVLGQTIPFAGDYGISNNPESFAVDSYRIYFADKQRGAVLRLSMDGLTPISDYGMKDYFKDNLKLTTSILGSYDASKDEYNITLKGSSSTTVSYSEQVKGWSSFKSFIPEQALSVANNYYSISNQNGTTNSKVWWHHQTALANNFYGAQYYSDVTLLLNQSPGVVKTYKTINYEGTQAKVERSFDSGSLIDDGEYYNLTEKTGWNAESITTDKQSGSVNEFIEKEGKWYNYIKGDITTLSNLDTGEFSVQGLGVITSHETN